MNYIGIDIGSTASKICILRENGEPEFKVMPTGWNSKITSGIILDGLTEELGSVEDCRIVATGYGRISVDYADKVITEISCHGRGGYEMIGRDCSIVDIGGQDTKFINVKGGRAVDFLMNDKCAAGTGRFLQVLSGILGMELAELGEAAGRGKPAAISSMCAVFAETEIIGLLARGTPPADIAAGVFRSIARRMRGLAARIPLHGECTFTGGLATSPSFSRLLSEELGVPVNVPEYPQLVGAIGAALIAARI